jgi:predicted DNA-binding antitoxin AbrB/MazE fold protein
MRVVKGVYENGVVALLEPVPAEGKQEVTVLIPNAGETTAVEALGFAGMLSDLSPEETAAFDEALKRGVQFARKVQP